MTRLAKVGQAVASDYAGQRGQGQDRPLQAARRVEAGEEVEIARNGVPIARLVRIEPQSPGERFLAAAGSMAGSIRIGHDFEFTEEELDEMLNNPRDPLG